MEIKQNIPLADFTSWLIGGPADFFCQPENIEELKVAVNFAKSKNLPITLLGGGSNVLVSDQGIEGLVISTRKFSKLIESEENGHLKITALSGTGKSDLLKIFLKHKLAPALFLAGLPGDIGGGIVMNAGVSEALVPREFGEIVEWIEVLRVDSEDLRIERLDHQQVQWSYRHTEGWQPGIVVQAKLSWPLNEDVSVLEKVRAANKNRLTKQPLHQPSCGSVFKNPLPHRAAQLIDSCGLKGFTVGGAQVSTKHANFIVNLGGAKATDVLSVVQHIKDTVLKQTGVALNAEFIKMGRGF